MRVESKLVDLRDGERRPTLIVRRDTATSDPAICVRLLPSGAELVERKPSAKQQICLVIDDWLQQAGQDGQFGVLLTLEESTKPPFDSQLRLEEAELPTSETSRRSRLLLGIQSKAKHYQHVYLECSTPERAKVVFDALRTLQPRRLPKPVDEPKVVAKVPPKPAPIAHDPPLTFVRHPEGTIKFLSADRVFQSPPKGDPMTPVVMDIAKQLEHFGAVGTFTLQDAGELDEPSATRTVALAGGIEIRIPLIIKRSDGALHRYWLTVNTFEQAAALARVLSVQQR
jgi:hypothetical protein